MDEKIRIQIFDAITGEELAPPIIDKLSDTVLVSNFDPDEFEYYKRVHNTYYFRNSISKLKFTLKEPIPGLKYGDRKTVNIKQKI